MPYYVYILASKRNGSLYIGSTSDLVKRIWEHKEKLRHGFTQRFAGLCRDYIGDTKKLAHCVKIRNEIRYLKFP